MIELKEFEKVEMKVGTIIDASINKKSKNKAYKLKIDLGDIGIKKTSAQITDLYNSEDLIGKQVIAICNLKPIHIGDITSEVRILGADTKEGVVLLNLERQVPNGAKIY